jgi:two-component system, sensor histidine kinase SagS
MAPQQCETVDSYPIGPFVSARDSSQSGIQKPHDLLRSVDGTHYNGLTPRRRFRTVPTVGFTVDHRPRILLIGSPPKELGDLPLHADLTQLNSPTDAADRLRADLFDAVLASAPLAAELIDRYRRDETILANVDQGVAALDSNGVVTWANIVLRNWCTATPLGRPLLTALGPLTAASDNHDPLEKAAAGQPTAFRVHRTAVTDHAYLDIRIRPVLSTSGVLLQSVVILQNVTAEVEQQRKLHALHAAGRELAALDPGSLAEMTVATRVELLKQNIRRHVHDLLRYDTIEIRLLDRSTGELKPLLEDGMTTEAAQRKLFARPDGNGVTGHVAFTGDSYLCPDTAHDPYYLEGAAGAKSSLTVPLKYADETIGTLNVESPRTNGFGHDDLQFAELFSKEIAAALHTLDLLSAQETCTLSQSIEAVNREIAIPVDEILAGAALLYCRLHDADPDAAVHLRRILHQARQLKECVLKVGKDALGDPAGTNHPLMGKRVLVVEQDERLRRQAHLLLGRLGAEVETVGTAAEGLALVNDAHYDAVLQEIRPTDMGGYDAFRRFRIALPTSRIALTTGFGYDAAHSIVKARQDGLQHVLFKPFRPDQVVTAVTAPQPPAPAVLPVTAAS